MKKELIALTVLACVVILAVPAMAAKAKPPKRVCYTVDGNANLTVQMATKKSLVNDNYNSRLATIIIPVLTT